MKIAILTADEPLYLPAFFDRFLVRRAAEVVGIFACEPIYKRQTKISMLRRYMRTFGLWNTLGLAWRVAAAKVKDRLRIGYARRRFYSVAAAAQYYHVPVGYPRDVNAPEFLDQLRCLGVDVILSVSCPQVFREDLIRLPARGCLNLHGADLPKYRGILPSFWMLAHGETQAGVTIFFINAGIDTGDVAGKRVFPILPDDTLESLIIRSKQEACDLALEALDRLEAGTIGRKPLQGEGSYFGFPTRDGYREFRRRGRRLR